MEIIILCLSISVLVYICINNKLNLDDYSVQFDTRRKDNKNDYLYNQLWLDKIKKGK